MLGWGCDCRPGSILLIANRRPLLVAIPHVSSVLGCVRHGWPMDKGTSHRSLVVQGHALFLLHRACAMQEHLLSFPIQSSPSSLASWESRSSPIQVHPEPQQRPQGADEVLLLFFAAGRLGSRTGTPAQRNRC